MTPIHLPWTSEHALGHAELDAQHQALFALCNRLAALCPPAPGATPADTCGGADDTGASDDFLAAYADLKAQARAHFAFEAALMEAAASPEVEDYRFACDEFETLADDIATPDHFSPLELQRFVALWWLGHVRGHGVVGAPANPTVVARAASATPPSTQPGG